MEGSSVAKARVQLLLASADTRILTSLCAACPHGPAGCCTAPPLLDWSDIARIVARGGREFLAQEIARERLAPVERGLRIRRDKRVPRAGAARVAVCAYHGEAGCTISPERRAATCNYYFCESAFDASAREQPAEVVAARRVRARLAEAYARLDDALASSVALTYPVGPPWDAPFLDWLGAQFEAAWIALTAVGAGAPPFGE